MGEDRTKSLRKDGTVVARPNVGNWHGRPAEQKGVLSRTDARHVVVLTERGQVLVQFLDTFLVSLDTLAHQLFFQLRSCQCTIQAAGLYRRELTRLRLVSSWRRSYSVLPSSGTRLSSLFFSRCSRSVVVPGFAVSSLAGVASLDEAAAVDLDDDDFFLRFFSMPVGLAPLSFRPPPADV